MKKNIAVIKTLPFNKIITQQNNLLIQKRLKTTSNSIVTRMNASFIKTISEPMKKKSNIALLIIFLLLISIPIVGFLSLKHRTKNGPTFYEYFYQTYSPQQQSSHYNIQIVYDVNQSSKHSQYDSTNQTQ